MGDIKTRPITKAVAWLRECHSWMMTNDLDMQCPMEDDPEDIADDLEMLLDPEPTADVVEAVTELVAMLSPEVLEEGCTVFDHTPEEIGLHVMENHAAIRSAIAAMK